MADSDDIYIAHEVFGPSELAELAPFGVERAVAAGEELYRAGDDSYDFFVVLDGVADITREGPDGDIVVARHGAGKFLGELNMLTGQRAYLTARMSEAGRVLAIERSSFRQMMSSKPELSDVIFRSFVARREILRAGEGAGAIRIIGSRYSPAAIALRSFANRSHLPTPGSTSKTWPTPQACSPVSMPMPVTRRSSSPRPKCCAGRLRASSPSTSA